MKKRIITGLISVSLLCFTGMSVNAVESVVGAMSYPEVFYTDYYAYGAEPQYPRTDDGEPILPTVRYHSTASFYVYVDTNNKNIAAYKTILPALRWRPVESKGERIQYDAIPASERAVVAEKTINIEYNPFNADLIAELKDGSVYYIQFGIAPGYYKSWGYGTAPSKMNAEINVLTEKFKLSEKTQDEYGVYEISGEWRFVGDVDDIEFCAMYGKSDAWMAENLEEFQIWYEEYKAKNCVPVSLHNTEQEPKVMKENHEVQTPSENLGQVIEPENAKEPIIIIEEKEDIAMEKEKSISTGFVIGAILATISAITLIILKLKERR